MNKKREAYFKPRPFAINHRREQQLYNWWLGGAGTFFGVDMATGNVTQAAATVTTVAAYGTSAVVQDISAFSPVGTLWSCG